MPKYIVSGEGGIIVISGTGLPGSVLKRHVSGTHIAREHHHHHKHVHIHKHIRKRIESKDVEGTVDIRAFLGGHKLASLVIGADPLTRASFVFSATNMSATPMYLRVNPHAPPISGNPDTKTVSLRMPIFQRNNVSTVDYCAQFDPQPTKPSPLTAEPCVANSTLHSSQEFAYTPSTGTVRPLWSSATFPADSPPLERSVNCEGPPSVQFNNMNATKPDNTTSVINPSAIVRNVTLYFTALDVAGEVYALEEPIFDSDSNNTRNDASYSPTPTSFANVPTSSMAHNYATNQGSYAQLPQPLNPVASSLPAITLEQAPTSGTTPLPTVTPAVASSIPTIPAVSAYEWMFTPDE
ncbi:uncharacterized protein EI90DRAFT_1386276 [Cantharellus anzutake]|uniref:uncharacterized protein n=1 Tax=Cantharellus anzutake TaxID=1750568 RepID=UPI00190420D0|nr:uncharacterized protein EI90DRAFT_1386276 [Cantharellus anzutake]KAF8329374.1 hypothetical protein EI90DRAFT_1386276 [Cantharellus anzutake]